MEATKVLNKKKMIAPKLRFMGFDYKHLGSGNIPVYGTGGLMTSVDKFLYDGETVCIGRKGTIDKPMFHNGKLWTVDTLFYTHSFINSTPKFVYSLFQKIKWKEHNEASGVPSLSKTTIEKIRISVPSLPEQQKIASFLSAVDEKIQQLTRKKELLEQYKKGVMQQLFSGKLRFKDENGKAFPKWEEKRLGEISKIYDGTHQTPIYVKEGIPFYSVEHVTANQFSQTKYISEEVFEKENLKVRLEKGDILMTKIGDIGTARLIDWDVRASFYVSLALIKNDKSFSSKYLCQYLASRNFQLELWKRIIHVAFPKKINLGEIGNCKILLPIIEEQKKIANFLSAIDTKIESVNNQLTHTQTFKKGLLQQMFV
jgi:type I restriction enzyme S subunit